MFHQLNAPVAGDMIATVKTSMGEIKIKLFPEYAPKAVENFTTHAKNGYYDVKGTSNITGTVPFQSYGLLINISGIGTSGYGFQLLLANNSTSTGTRIAMRVRINNTWIGWTTLS